MSNDTLTLTCKPLNECTADDLTPIDERLRADAIDYLAGNGRDVSFAGGYSIEHLLRLCAEIDDSVGCGPDTGDGIITICEGGFSGHFASPETIERRRAQEQAQAERALFAVRSRVEALELEAGEAGDWDEVALCRLALGADLADGTIGGRPGDRVLSRPWTRAEAVRHVTARLNG